MLNLNKITVILDLNICYGFYWADLPEWADDYKSWIWVESNWAKLSRIKKNRKMADDTQFGVLLTSLLSIYDDTRKQAEVSIY